MAFERVAILGVGLLGGSVGLALRSRGLAHHITGIGRNRTRLEKALKRNAVTEFFLLDEQWPEDISLLILAAPVEQIGYLLKKHRSKIRNGTIVTDVGSTKSRLVSTCQEILGAGHRFVGSHPMAGSHQTGVEHADADLFVNRTCVVTPTRETDPEAKKTVTCFWESLGAHVMELSPEEHDYLVARTSHLPHFIAATLCSVLAKLPDDRARRVVGSGFQDATRIAAGESGLWTEICRHNREEILNALEEFIGELQSIRETIAKADLAGIERFLEEARKYRAQFGEDSDSEV
ncbi:MAG TPA: prephenate dehydrogenase/arogenate dehydrogenase family protein [bacterium]|nr:prephenate dehydrogenase/arogenate dehydrogenase family protein [bacterium]HQL63014.1 prephenate dehydrogenase/arogenate dehydrogenase family protein [bacterium]